MMLIIYCIGYATAGVTTLRKVLGSLANCITFCH